VAVPVAEPFEPYLHEVVDKLRKQGIRAELDTSDDRFGKKIRNASTQKVPFVLIAGGEDEAAGAVSFRYRDGRQDNGVPVDEAVERIVTAVRERAQV
jgi:threonyl-tRNA synthetase